MLPAYIDAAAVPVETVGTLTAYVMTDSDDTLLPRPANVGWPGPTVSFASPMYTASSNGTAVHGPMAANSAVALSARLYGARSATDDVVWSQVPRLRSRT